MLFLGAFWRWLTNTAALNQLNGDYERMFFEEVYRVVYLTGFSSYDKGIVYLLYSSTVKLLIALFICSEIWYLYSELSSLDTIVENISVTLINLLSVYRYIDLSENICQSIYFSGWELGLVTVPGVKRRLMLIVERAQRPMVLTAGGLYELSLVSYTAIVKVSYSALTVLLRLR